MKQTDKFLLLFESLNEYELIIIFCQVKKLEVTNPNELDRQLVTVSTIGIIKPTFFSIIIIIY